MVRDLRQNWQEIEEIARERDRTSEGSEPHKPCVDDDPTVKGKIKGASGDQQFRMYAVLRDDAVEILDKSREFKRGPDNTVFHRGFVDTTSGNGETLALGRTTIGKSCLTSRSL